MIGKNNKRILISDYDQEIEVWSETKGVYGQGNTTTKLFTTLAKIEELSGSKALQYQQQGIGNPVLIEMNWIPVLPDYIMWEGNKIPITSFIDPDNHMRRRVIMLGSFIKTYVLFPQTPTPPLEDSILRRLQALENYNWIDLIANRDVNKKLLPVSEFDGINGEVQAADSPDLNITGAITYYAFIKAATIQPATNARIAAKLNQYFFTISAGNPNIFLSGVTNGSLTSLGDSLLDNTVHCVLFQYDGISTIRIFVDGSQVAIRTDVSGLIDTSINPFRLGFDGGGIDYFSGAIFESRLYDRYLNDAEIATLSSGGVVDGAVLSIPLPHLSTIEEGVRKGWGYDANGVAVRTTITGGVTEGFDIEGSHALLDDGFSIKDGNIIPHNSDGLAIIQDYDTDYAGTNGLKLNTSPTRLELFPPFQIDEEYAFFDTSNILIWKTNFEWDAFDLSQQFIDDNIQDAYKDRLFIKISTDGIIEDFMLYPDPLNAANLALMNEYLNS